MNWKQKHLTESEAVLEFPTNFIQNVSAWNTRLYSFKYKNTNNLSKPLTNVSTLLQQLHITLHPWWQRFYFNVNTYVQMCLYGTQCRHAENMACWSRLWRFQPGTTYLPCRLGENWGVSHHVDSLMLVIWGREFLQCGLHAPDLTGILGNGAIAGELARPSDVVDHLLGPFFGVLMWGRILWIVIIISYAVEIIWSETHFSRTHLVKSIDFLLAFNIVFIVSKDLKSVQKTMQLTHILCNMLHIRCDVEAYGGNGRECKRIWVLSLFFVAPACKFIHILICMSVCMHVPQAANFRCVFTCHDASTCWRFL